jgi:hypothetical protein
MARKSLKSKNKIIKKVNKTRKQSPMNQFNQISAPVAIGRVASASIQSDLIVRNREYVGNISTTASASFALIGNSATFPGYDINPACVQLFPWLTQIASAYEKYRFEKLRFQVVPRNSTYNTGTIYAAIDYDWDDTPANNAGELMANKGAISGNVWQAMQLEVDVKRLNLDVPYRYVADFPRAQNSQRMVYGGFLMLAIAGTDATTSFDVFVDYMVKFDLPALHTINASSTYTYPASYTVVANTVTPISTVAIQGIQQVLSGSGGVPSFAGVSGTQGFQVPNSSRGNLNLTVQPATTGVAPSVYATDTSAGFTAFKSDGTALGVVPDGAFSGKATFQGPDTDANWSTNGAVGKIVQTLSFLALRQLLPSAAYIVPYIFSAAGRVLNTSSNNKIKYIEL